MDDDRKNKSLEIFLAREYQIKFHTKNAINYLVIDELQIIVSNEDIKKAQGELRNEKIKLFNTYFDAGIVHEIPLPGYRNNSFKDDLLRFGVKLGITGLILFVLMLSVTGPVVHKLKQKINIEDSIKKILYLSDNIENMDEHRKDEIKKQIRKFSNSVSPFISEMQPILRQFRNETNQGVDNNNN